MKSEPSLRVVFTVNGSEQVFHVHPGDRLLDTLRHAGYTSVKEGCGDGNCGTCVILLNGRPVTSCLILSARVDGCTLTTVEGIGTPDRPHPLQESYADHGAVQCGFCTPGSILSSFALLQENPHPDEDQIKRAMDGNACRCTGYVKKLAAVVDYSRKNRR